MSQNGAKTQVFSTFWPANVVRATAACNFLTSNLQKVVRTRQFVHILTYKYASRHSRVPFFNIVTSKMAPTPSVFSIFTCKCASRHSRVPFLNIGTSKMAPRMWCFAHFDLQMCFTPQRGAIFRHRNFKKCSEHEVFCTHFDLKMWFSPQRRAIFHLSAEQLPPHPPL